MNLTPHFALAELTTRGRHPEIDNTPPADLMANGQALAELLEIIRAALDGRHLRVNYGYRSKALNIACGGSHTSAHVEFCAADVVPDGWSLAGAFQHLIQCSEVMEKIDQIILESGCLHIGIRLERHGMVPRHEIRKESWATGRRAYPLIGHWTPQGVKYV